MPCAVALDEPVSSPRPHCRPLRRLYGPIETGAGVLPTPRGTSPVERKSRNNHTSKVLDARALSPFAVEDSFAAAARAAFAQPDTVQAVWRDVQKTPWRERERVPVVPDPREVQQVNREPTSPRVSPRKNMSSTDLSLGLCQEPATQKRITEELFSGGPRCKNSVPYNSRGKNSVPARTSKLRHEAPWASHPGFGVPRESCYRSRSLDADGRVAGVTRRARWSLRARMENSTVDAPYSTEDQGGGGISSFDSPVSSRRPVLDSPVTTKHHSLFSEAPEGNADSSLLDTLMTSRRQGQSQPQPQSPVRRMVTDGGYGVRTRLPESPAGAGSSIFDSLVASKRQAPAPMPVMVQRMRSAPALHASLSSPGAQFRHLEPAGKSALALDAAGVASGSGIRCDKWSWAK